MLLKYRHSYKGDCSGVTGEHPAKLKSLDLRRNPSTESAFSMGLRRQDFEGLLNLVELDLADTGLGSLPAGVFDGLASLETLNLNKNRLGSLPALTLLWVDPAGRMKLQVAGGEGDAALEVAAGGSVTYPVRLMAAPDFRVTAANPVRIGVSSDTAAGVVATPATRRFTKENWFRRQTVTVLDDAHDEGEATGTIANHDPMPKALVARFGRTAVAHVVEHVEERLAAPREPGFRGRFAGRELRRGMERDIALDFLRQLGGTAGAGPLGAGAGGPLSGAPAAGPGRTAGSTGADCCGWASAAATC